MTLEEKLAYIGGSSGFIRPIPRLGIPEIRMADGFEVLLTLTVRCIMRYRGTLPRHI